MKLDTITVIKPTIKPTISIIPRSKPKISAAASGFGVGGTTQCAVVAPIVRLELSIFVQCLNPQNYAASANGCSRCLL